MAHRFVGFDIAASVITDLGSPIATAAAGTFCAALLCWRARSTIPGIIVLCTVGAAALAGTALKAVVDRLRPLPQWQIVLETDPSFPSGHVTGSAALLGIIAVCVGTARSRTVLAWLASGVVTTYAAGRVNRDTRIAADRDGMRCVSSRVISEPHLERRP